MKILIIEDDEGIVEFITMAFRMVWPDCNIASVSTGSRGVDLVGELSPDIVILDLGLPDINGFEVLSHIRKFSNVPILIISVRNTEQYIVKGIELGADEYVVKPFGQLEIVARVKALLRRNAPKITNRVIAGPLVLNPLSGDLSIDHKRVQLTRTESIILSNLMINNGEVVTYQELAEAIWGEDYSNAQDTLRVYIKRLRNKIEVNNSNPVFICSKLGVGYYLSYH